MSLSKIILGFVIYGYMCTGLHAQEIEVLILGIAQDAGHPQIGCVKPCCSESYKNTLNQHRVASLAISDGENFYIIDATPSIVEQYQTASDHFSGMSLGGIFLTHAHIGHYTGLMHFGREAMSSKELPVYVMPRMKNFLEKNGPWSQLVELKNIELHDLQDEKPVSLGELTILPLEVPHRDEFSETVGYLIKGSSSSLLYIPDIDKWETWDRPIDKLISKVDFVLLDGTFFDGDEVPGRNLYEIPHPFVVESIEHLRNLSDENKNKVYFIHLNHTNPLLDTDNEAYQRVIKEGMHIAKRGMTFQL